MGRPKEGSYTQRLTFHLLSVYGETQRSGPDPSGASPDPLLRVEYNLDFQHPLIRASRRHLRNRLPSPSPPGSSLVPRLLPLFPCSRVLETFLQIPGSPEVPPVSSGCMRIITSGTGGALPLKTRPRLPCPTPPHPSRHYLRKRFYNRHGTSPDLRPGSHRRRYPGPRTPDVLRCLTHRRPLDPYLARVRGTVHRPP